MTKIENSKKQIFSFIGSAVLLIVFHCLFLSSKWIGNIGLHTLMETVSTLLALIIGVMGLLNYYTKKERIYLFIGAGFIGVFFLDGYHGLITTEYFQSIIPSDLKTLIPWTWLSSRTFLSFILLVSLFSISSKTSTNNSNDTNEEVVYLSIGIFTLIPFIFFAFFPLPQAYFDTFFFKRPEELIPASVFSLALWGFLKKGAWKNNVFEHWIILSLIISVISQVVIMPFSMTLFDYQFNMAHFYKILSYLCVLAGLLINMFIIFRREVMGSLALTKKNFEIKANSERLDMAMEGSNDGLLDWDLHANQIYCSPNFEKMLGFDQGKLIKEVRSLWNLLHHEDIPEVTKTLLSQIKSGEAPFEMEHRMKTRDGNWKWFLTRGKVVERDDQEMASRGVATLTDITERRKVQDELTASLLRLNALFNNVVDGIVIMNEKGAIQSLNPAAENMFKSEQGELNNKNIRVFLPEKERANHSNPINKFLKTHQPDIIGSTNQIECQKSSGEIFSLELIITELNLPDEQLYVGIMRDVTEQLAVERIKNNFVVTVSHELRTPLTSIKGSLEILNSGLVGDIPPKMKNMVEIALKNSERLTQLTNEILDLEKIEAGRMDFQMRRLDLNELAKEAIEINKDFGAQFDVSFTFNQETENSLVLADPTRLLQVFTNLMSNASKFSPTGKCVKIKTTEKLGMIRVSVTDKGPGVTDSFKDKLFDKFTQEDSTNTRTKGGTGLGLSISKAIVEKHGGKIGFMANSPKGSVFYFELPHLGSSVEN